MERATSEPVEPTTFLFEHLSPDTAAIMLATRRRGVDRQDAIVRSYAQDMAAGRWIVNGNPIVISRRGILLDGVQRLLACVEAGVAFPTFVARNVDDDVEYTIDQHHRRSCASILSARGVPHAHTLMALITRLMIYDDLTHGRAKAMPPSWGQVEGILAGNPGLQAAVAVSLAMTGSPLPEPVRTAILYLGREVDPEKTDRLLVAAANPESFAHGEPGALLRLELDRLAGTSLQGHERNLIFALAIKALNATMRGESLRHIGWVGRAGASEPAEPFPVLEGYKGLALSGPAVAVSVPDGEAPAVGFTAAFEVIDQAAATRYLAMKIAKREVVKTHVSAMARDIAAGRWMRNAQPICFSRSGRLMNGQHRLMAVIASRGTIVVPVMRGLPDAAYATYDTHARRAPPVEADAGAFGDQALAAAMANLLWRRERRTPTTRGKKATVAEIRQIQAEFPRLLGLRGFARRMVSFGRSSVMGYGAFVIERDLPQQAPGFLRGLETGADLPEGHPILALREQLQRLRRDGASQDEQLGALLAGWERFKARQHLREAPGPRPAQEAVDGLASRYARSLKLANAALLAPAPVRPQRLAAAAGAVGLSRQGLQQSLTAAYVAFAVRHVDSTQLMQEAARIAAEGLASGFATVMEHQSETGSLLLRGGVGWRDGVIGAVRLPTDASSPAGYAFMNRQKIASDDLTADQRFTTPSLLSDHGLRRVVSVLIPGSGAPVGVLEVGDTRAGAFSTTDIRFLETVGGALGLALERSRAAAANAMLRAERSGSLAGVRGHVGSELQAVHAMLSLAAQGADSAEARRALERSAVRVISIAAVHEQLDQADGADSVEMRSYLTGLVNLLQARLAGPLGGRSIELSAEAGARWSPQRAKAIGLVLGELLADAMSRDANGLRIRFEEGPDGAQMALEDSRGDRPLSDAEGEGIGLGLVAVLLKEQGAEVSIIRHEGGSRVVVAFPPCVGAG